jgi:hypothetical protein
MLWIIEAISSCWALLVSTYSLSDEALVRSVACDDEDEDLDFKLDFKFDFAVDVDVDVDGDDETVDDEDDDEPDTDDADDADAAFLAGDLDRLCLCCFCNK